MSAIKPTTAVSFRSCKEVDLFKLQGLAEGLYAYHPAMADKKPDCAATYKELTARPDKGRIVIFEQNCDLIGYAIIIFFWSNEYSGNVIEVDELYIDGNWRGTGAATNFFAWLNEEYKGFAAGFSLQVSHANPQARKLYERTGFKTSRNEHMFWILPKE